MKKIIPNHIKSTKFFNELSLDDSNLYFDFKRDKFLHNIDSIYYTIKLKNDWSTDLNCLLFKDILTKLKDSNFSDDDLIFFPESDFIVHSYGLPRYPFFLEMPNEFSVFFSNSCSDNTPEIWVQIRSEFLWLYGEHYCCKNSIDIIENLLLNYNIFIDEIKENRIDYAYHTNYIQDPLNFFKEEKLNSMQISNFKRYSLEGALNGSDDVDRDYITLGRKKSNNLFFRVYNKSKEVIEKGYKQFFIDIWLKNGLISYYDKYCLEYAFINSNYNSIHKARLLFYLDNGIDDSLKLKINKLLSNKSKSYYDYKSFANSFMPRVNIICNIEIETKRKFYHSLDKSVDSLLTLHSDCKVHSSRLFIKLDNKKIFHDFITNNVIRFIDRDSNLKKSRCKTSYFWYRLQNVDLNSLYNLESLALSRTYQSSLDIKKLKDKTLKSVASLSLYLNVNDSEDIKDDIVDVLSLVNENDVQKIAEYKKKKFANTKNSIVKTKISSRNDLAIININTGEVI